MTDKKKLSVKRGSPGPKKSVRARKPAAAPERSKGAPEPSLRLYRRLALGFVAIVVAVLAIVLLISSVNVTIDVFASPQTVETDVLVDVVSVAATEGRVPGTVAVKSLEQAKTFASSGEEKKEVLGKAGGMVTIYNTGSRVQQLVATTRLLTPEGVLFRIDAGVTVPANGSISTMAHADQPGPEGDIGASSFTIPGLSASMQQIIYAKSEAPMSGGRAYVSVVSQADLDAAGEELKAEMLSAMQSELEAERADFDGVIMQTDVVKQASDTEPGAETDAFTITLSLKVTAVFYDASALSNLSDAKLFEQVRDGYALLDPSSVRRDVVIERANAEEKVATLHVKESGFSVVAATHEALRKESFVGLKAPEVRDALMSKGIATDVKVLFFPPWVRSVPALPDHVNVRIITPK